MNLAAIVALGQALGDPTRLRVLDAVDGKLAVGQIAAALNMTSATISHHLALLQRAGLVTVERRGRRCIGRRVPDVGRLLARAIG